MAIKIKGTSIIDDDRNLVTGNTASFTGAVTASQLVSTAATGTAPFTVTSNTVVTNLNADHLDGFNGSYYLDYTNTTNKPTIGNGTVTLATSGIATGSASITMNQTGNSTFTVNVPGTNISSTSNSTVVSVTSSTGTGTTINTVNSTTAGVMASVDKVKLDSVTVANTFSTTGNFPITLNATGSTTITLPTSGTLAVTGAGLNQFATSSTTSAQLATVISDETGSGALVFATSPTLSGTPTAPTAAVGTNNTQIATTAFVSNEIAADSTSSNTANKIVLRDPSGNFSANVITANGFTALGGNIIATGTGNASFEIGRIDGIASTPYIDFHSGATFSDYDSRIIASGGTGGLGGGTLKIQAATLELTGNVTGGTWSGSFGAVSGANLTNLTAGNLVGTIPSTVLGNSTVYVGTTAIALNRASVKQGLTGISSIALPGATSGTITITPAATAGTTAITIPATSGTIVTTGDSATVTNAMLAGSIAVSKLAASTISGVTLGGTLPTLTNGAYLTGSNYNGSSATTWDVNATSTNTGSAIVARDASGDFAAGEITATRIKLTATSDANTTSTLHAFQVGSDTGQNLIIDNNEIFARNNGSASALNINTEGGVVNIGQTGGLDDVNIRGGFINLQSQTFASDITATAINAAASGGGYFSIFNNDTLNGYSYQMNSGDMFFSSSSADIAKYTQSGSITWYQNTNLSRTLTANGSSASHTVTTVFGANTRIAAIGTYKNSSLNDLAGYMRLQREDGTNGYLWVDTDGMLRIGTSATLVGLAGTNGTVVGLQTSDERLKDIDETFEYGIDTVRKLKPIRYRFINDSYQTDRLGFGAQTTRAVVPEAVTDTNECIDGYTTDPDDDMKQTPNSDRTKLAMDGVQLIPVLTKALQEALDVIDDLKARIAALEIK